MHFDSRPEGWRLGEADTEVRTFLIADVRGYTRFTEEYGDEVAARLAGKFADVVHDGVEARGGKLRGFAICGEDKKFVWADAEVVGDKVSVSSSQVSKPVAVRYAWATNPSAALFNRDGLPAVPFRTDDWPAATEANR